MGVSVFHELCIHHTNRTQRACSFVKMKGWTSWLQQDEYRRSISGSSSNLRREKATMSCSTRFVRSLRYYDKFIMIQVGYIPRFGCYGIYKPRNNVARLINHIATSTSAYSLYLQSSYSKSMSSCTCTVYYYCYNTISLTHIVSLLVN